jgi:ketosteroid isomerase-like protein
MTGITETQAAVLAAHHVSEFNDAVAAKDFSEFLCLFTDDAVIRFENVPGAGQLEFAGRQAYVKAYAEHPPDDQIDISGKVEPEAGDVVVVPFVWRRDRSRGTIRLTFTAKDDDDDLDSRLVTRMTVIFE